MSYGKRDCERMARELYGEDASVSARLSLGVTWVVEVWVRSPEPGRGFITDVREASLRKAYDELGVRLRGLQLRLEDQAQEAAS